MKRKMLALLMALCMTASMAVPAFAAETATSGSDAAVSGSDSAVSSTDTSDSDANTSDSDAEVSDSDAETSGSDADEGETVVDVDKLYAAYSKLADSLKSNDMDKVRPAVEEFFALSDMLNEMEDEDREKLGELMDCKADRAPFIILSVYIDANVLVETEKLYDNFVKESTPYNAIQFVKYHNSIFSDPDYVDENLRATVRSFFPEIDKVYAQAMEKLPAKEIMAVYNAFEDIKAALASNTFESVEAKADAYREAMIAATKFNTEQLTRLSEVMGLSLSEAVNQLNSNYTLSTIIMDLGKVYNAYSEDQSKANADALVNKYESLKSQNHSKDVWKVIEEFFYDIHDLYNELTLLPVTRLQGDNRIETAIAISARGFTSSEAVILASGDNYADALAGAPLAYTVNAPMLLVSGGAVSDSVLKEIERLEATEVYILGGESAISAESQKKLEDSGCTVNRIAGKDRFETAVAIAMELEKLSGEASQVFFVYGYNYPDALAVSSVAALNSAPILYLPANGVLSAATTEYVKGGEFYEATIVGGPNAVSADAENNIRAAGISKVARVYGQTRYETCLEINKAYDYLFAGDAVCVATGENFPDALAGGVFAADQMAPIVLVGKKLTEAQTKYLSDRETAVTYIFGGQAAVSAEVEKQLNELA